MFQNKVILITGASSGLGRALAIALSQQGAQLVLIGRNQQELTETARHCQPVHPPLVLVGDVSQSAECSRVIHETIDQYGRLDYLILNAGISMWSAFEDLTDLTAIDQLMATNYFGAVYCTYYALPFLKKTRGLITVISSIQGKIGVPFHTGYAASKHALQGFFDSLRMELKKQVDVLLVCPGWIKDTALKQRAIRTQAALPTKHKQASLSLDSCVTQILTAMAKRQRELILPRFYRLVPFIKAISQRFLDYLIQWNM